MAQLLPNIQAEQGTNLVTLRFSIYLINFYFTVKVAVAAEVFRKVVAVREAIAVVQRLLSILADQGKIYANPKSANFIAYFWFLAIVEVAAVAVQEVIEVAQQLPNIQAEQGMGLFNILWVSQKIIKT